MKILFSPSEMKSEQSGGPRICEQNFIFADLYEKRLQMLRAYAELRSERARRSFASFSG